MVHTFLFYQDYMRIISRGSPKHRLYKATNHLDLHFQRREGFLKLHQSREQELPWEMRNSVENHTMHLQFLKYLKLLLTPWHHKPFLIYHYLIHQSLKPFMIYILSFTHSICCTIIVYTYLIALFITNIERILKTAKTSTQDHSFHKSVYVASPQK